MQLTPRLEVYIQCRMYATGSIAWPVFTGICAFVMFRKPTYSKIESIDRPCFSSIRRSFLSAST